MTVPISLGEQPNENGQARQLTVVALNGIAVLIDGESGLGKTSLALALIDRGARLVGDDSVLLDGTGPRLVARPHPHTVGLVEVRNLGLLTMPAVQSAVVGLWITLDHEAPRFIESAETKVACGHAIPHLAIWPAEAGLMAIKVELALETYGLFPGE